MIGGLGLSAETRVLLTLRADLLREWPITGSGLPVVGREARGPTIVTPCAVSNLHRRLYLIRYSHERTEPEDDLFVLFVYFFFGHAQRLSDHPIRTTIWVSLKRLRERILEALKIHVVFVVANQRLDLVARHWGIDKSLHLSPTLSPEPGFLPTISLLYQALVGILSEFPLWT